MSLLHHVGGQLVWDLRADEHALLVVMLGELDHALDAPTDDPVVQRLFPAAVEGDDDEDAELRMLIAGDLLLQRHEAIREMLAVLERPAGSDGARSSTAVLADASRDTDPDTLPRFAVPLHEDEPGTMLAILNDVRLALAARVGLTAIELPQLVEPDDDRTHGLLEIMDAFAYFQMQLLRHIDPTSVRYADPGDDEA